MSTIHTILRVFLFVLAGVILLPAVTFLINPRHVVNFSDNPVDEKLYADISFGPIEISLPLFKVGLIAKDELSYQFYRWSPDENYFAFMADLPKSEQTEEKYDSIIILNPRTFQKKTILISDYKGHYAWVDNHTIRYFRGMGAGVGIYKDVDTNTKKPLMVIEDLNYEFSSGWHPITLAEMSIMEKELANYK